MLKQCPIFYPHTLNNLSHTLCVQLYLEPILSMSVVKLEGICGFHCSTEQMMVQGPPLHVKGRVITHELQWWLLNPSCVSGYQWSCQMCTATTEKE